VVGINKSDKMFNKFTQDRLLYLVGVCQLVLTPFTVAYNITMAKYMHMIKFLIFMPMRFLAFKKRKWHYYMVEFCYYASLLLNLFILQERCFGGIFNKYFISIYGITTGPLLWATIFNNDKLFVHSQSHLTSTYIHLTPALMAWGLRWNNNNTEFLQLFPLDFSYYGIKNSYIELLYQFRYTYMPWFIVYYFYMFDYKWERIIEKDNKTMYRQFAENNKSLFGQLVNKIDNRYIAGLLYMIIHLTSALITALFAIVQFHNIYINTTCVIIAFLITNWAGSYKIITALHLYEKCKTKQKERQDQKLINEPSDISSSVVSSAKNTTTVEDVDEWNQTTSFKQLNKDSNDKDDKKHVTFATLPESTKKTNLPENIRRNKSITNLPESIKKIPETIKNLPETVGKLKLTQTILEQLPDSITESSYLQKLKQNKEKKTN
jgi:hypothetical protein